MSKDTVAREDFDVVGKSVPRKDAREKATGWAKYTVDLADVKFRDALSGRILRSEHPHARILSIDTSRAERLEGVAAVVTGTDVPLVRCGRNFKDRTMFAVSSVRYHGDALAAVAAIDLETAELALSLIDVQYEELPAVLDPIEAMRPGSALVHEDRSSYPLKKVGPAMEGLLGDNVATITFLEQGDLEKGFAESDFIFEGSYRTQRQCHCTLEPRAAIADFDPASDKLTIWTSTSSPTRTRMGVCDFLGLPTSKVKIVPSWVGSAFGGKLEAELEPFCAMLAMKARKPVKIVNTREEEFRVTYSRQPAVHNIRTGVKKDGTLMARDVRLVYNTGSRANFGSLITAYCSIIGPGPYRIPNARATGYCVYTNNIPGGAFRGFGQLQLCFAVESQMDEIAVRLGIDPVELRLMNAVEEGDLTLHRQVRTSVTMKECLLAAAEKSGWQEKRNRQHNGGTIKRGIGIACTEGTYGGFTSGATVKVSEDGCVTLSIGAADIGTGSNTVLAQIAAEELGVRYEDIQVLPPDTDSSPFDFGSFASRVTYHTGNAVKSAAADARRQLLEVAAELLDTENLVAKGGKIFVKGSPGIGLTFSQVARRAHLEKERTIVGVGSNGSAGYTGEGAIQGMQYGPTDTNQFGTQVAEVEVDTETGQVELVALTSVLDCGRAINPMAVEGQIEGGAAIGIGFALLEELATPGGRVANGNLVDYLLPTAMDVPDIVSIFIEKEQPGGPFGAKGMGDVPPVGGAAAIANAVFDAVGVRIKELPITSDKVLAALREKGGERESS